MSEVNNHASLLGLTRYEREDEECWRTRVAYAMQAHVWACEGKQVPERIQARMNAWNEKAKEA